MATSRDIIFRCRNYVAANDFAAAEQAIAELVALDECRAQAAYFKGAVNFRRGDYKAAREALDESLLLGDNSIETMELKIRILSLEGNIEGAADLAEQMVAMAPGSIGALNVCAKALAKAGRVVKAANVWSRIAEMAPADPTPLLASAAAYFKAKAFNDACDMAFAAFERESSSRSLVLAADSAAKVKNLERLSSAASKLAEIDGQAALKYTRLLLTPEYVSVAAQIVVNAGVDSADAQDVVSIVGQLVKVARNAEKTGEEVEAAGIWRLVLQLDPLHEKAASSLRRHISGLMKAGIALLDNDEVAEAVAVFRRLVALDPAVGTAWRKLAIALNRQGDFAEEAEAWRSLARLTGDTDAWQRALRSSRKCDPSEGQLLMFVDARSHLEGDASLTEKGDSLARKLGKSGFQRAGAEPFAATFATLEAIMLWNPENPIVEKLRGRLSAVLQRVLRSPELADEERTEAAERLLTIDQTNLNALQWLSRVYFKSRKFEAASAVFERLIEISPEDKTYWHYLSRCRKALKKPELSVDFASQQAELHPEGAAGAYLEEVAA